MSADLYIWDVNVAGNTPTTYAEADVIFAKLVDVKTDVNPKFIQFAERLYALIQAMPEQDDELLSYYENFLAETQQIKKALYVVGLPPFNFIEAIRLIVQSAGEFGLVVMDGQSSATVFLPNGSTLPPEQAQMWQSAWQYMDEDDDFPKTVKAFEKKVEPLVAAIAARHGFVKSKHPVPQLTYFPDRKGYVRDVPMGKQFIYPSYQGGRGEFRFSIQGSIINEQYASIFTHFNFKAGREFYLSTTNLKDVYFISGTKVENQFELNALMLALEQKYFSLLNQAQTIQVMDRLYNGDLLPRILSQNVDPLDKVVVAHLAGNSQFEDIVTREESLDKEIWNTNQEIWATEFPKLVNYLRMIPSGTDYSLTVSVLDTIGSQPSNHTEAQSLFTQASNTQAGINPKYIQFAERLSALIQSATEPDAELQRFYQSIFNDAKQMDKVVFVVQLPRYDHIEAIRLIVQCAAEMGLLVKYDSPETIFFPDGKTLPIEQAQKWQAAWQYADKSDLLPKTLAEFENLAEAMFAEMAARHGFKKWVHPESFAPFDRVMCGEPINKGYMKEVPFGRQFINVECKEFAENYSLSIDLYYMNEEYTEIAKKFKKNAVMLRTRLALYHGYRKCDGSIIAKSRSHFSEQLLSFEQQIFPVLAQLHTLADIDNLLNNLINNSSNILDYNYFSPPETVIVARLVGNPRFEEIVAKAQKQDADRWGYYNNPEDFKSDVPKLIEYLRGEVKPIV